jgi:hypothetical protein
MQNMPRNRGSLRPNLRFTSFFGNSKHPTNEVNMRHFLNLSLFSLFSVLLNASSALGGQTVPNIISLRISHQDRNYLQETEKYVFTNAQIKFNDSSWSVVGLKTRGQNCLGAPRRCFSVKANGKFQFLNANNENSLSLKKFNLVSMWQDEGYITSEMGYKFYEQSGTYFNKRVYAQVYVNGKNQGLYLVIEKPADSIKKKFSTPFIGRREYFSKLETKKYYPKKTTLSEKDFLKSFKFIKKAPISSNESEGQNAYNTLASKMNIKRYMRWLAMHTIMQNGDYSDEVYFYATVNEKNDIYWDIMGHDLDGLFDGPHLGLYNTILRRNEVKRSLLWSLEEKLDRKINKSPYLYAKFKEELNDLLQNSITAEFIQASTEELKNDILPYLTKENLELSSLDDRPSDKEKVYSKKYILDLLEFRKNFLLDRRVKLIQLTGE